MSTTVDTNDIRDLDTDVRNLRDKLDEWDGGTFRKDRQHQRLAARDALDSIDAALRLLHDMRAELIRETRRYDDETIRRSDQLLREIRAAREATQS